jgi:hypothetical protein
MGCGDEIIAAHRPPRALRLNLQPEGQLGSLDLLGRLGYKVIAMRQTDRFGSTAVEHDVDLGACEKGHPGP